MTAGSALLERTHSFLVRLGCANCGQMPLPVHMYIWE